MATENTTSKDAAKDKADAPAADKYPVPSLISRATEYLGVESYVAAGGLSGVKGPLALEDARARINKWLDQPLSKEG